ncbi:MAG: RNA polymerase sigma factor [Planctomycetota bacterium]
MPPNRSETLKTWFASEGPHLYCWLRARLGPSVRRNLDLEDLMQEVWFRAMRNPGSDDVVSPRAWLLSIARNVLMEALRSTMRQPIAALAGAEGTSPELADEVTTLTRRIARDESRQKFFRELDGLEEDERLLLVQHGLEQRPIDHVARLLGISTDAAHKRWQRLRDRLRQLGSPAELL